MTDQTADEDHRLAIQLTIIIAVSVLLLNVLFYFLSGYYYDDKKATQGMMSTITASTVTSTRVSFGIFSGVTGAALVGSLFSPKWVGHIIAGGFGVAAFVAAIFAGRAGTPLALTVSLVVIGALFPALSILSLMRRSRAAWAFLSSMCWVLAIIMLFGAPKIRSQIDIGLWTAMLIPGLLAAAATALTMVRRDYR